MNYMIKIFKVTCLEKILLISEKNLSFTHQITPTKEDDNDDMYFYSKEKEKKETNEIKTDDDNSFNYKKNSDFNDTESINSNHLIYNIILHKEIV